MAKEQFVLIQLPKRTAVNIDRIRPTLDLARDWIALSPNTWLVWTTSSPEKWFRRITKVFGADIRVFICVVDAKQRHGRMPKAFWDFLNRKNRINSASGTATS